MNITIIFNIIQIILALLLTVVVLMQSSSASSSTLFGGSTSINSTKRGSEKALHRFTIFLVILFCLVSLSRTIFLG